MNKLQAKITDFGDALDAFRGCPEMIMSCPPSPAGKKISDRFFGLREELEAEGLKLHHKNGNYSALESALLRWAVWCHTASFTASLNQADPWLDKVDDLPVGWPDSADIMRHLDVALVAMFDALDVEKAKK